MANIISLYEQVYDHIGWCIPIPYTHKPLCHVEVYVSWIRHSPLLKNQKSKQMFRWTKRGRVGGLLYITTLFYGFQNWHTILEQGIANLSFCLLHDPCSPGANPWRWHPYILIIGQNNGFNLCLGESIVGWK